MEHRAFLVGIGGGSGSGKTMLSRALVGRATGSALVELDAYYLDRSHVAAGGRGRLNYDEPGAFDVDLLIEHLGQLAHGVGVLKPRYSFESHTRTGSDWQPPASLIFVEGLFTLWWNEVRRLCDVTVFLDSPADVRILRRLQRDVVERGRTVDEVCSQYVETVRPMHERYVEPTRRFADLVMVTDGPLESNLGSLHTALQRLGAPLPPTVRPDGASIGPQA